MSKLGHQINQTANLIRRPRLTEKASQSGTYIFEVAPAANKPMIKKAIKALYGVTPQRVNIINLSAKKIMVRGRPGQQPGVKKAIITLKPGDKIDLA